MFATEHTVSIFLTISFVSLQYFGCISCVQSFRNREKFVKHVAELSIAPDDQITSNKSWTHHAIQRMWEERENMGTTNIFTFEPPGFPETKILFKNESSSPTHSLKHRYSWALMMWALIEQKVKEDTHVFEASSGNTACSLGYMCKMLGLNFTAIVPDTLEIKKQQRITDQGGSVVRVPISQRLIKASELAEKSKGFFMNQFKNAYYAEEYHDSGDFHQRSANIFHEFLSQVPRIPDYFVHPAGTGGTLSSIGRYVRKYALDTEIVLADTQYSVYFDYVLHGRFFNESGASKWVNPGMSGIGFGPMGKAELAETTSLDPAVIDRVLKIPDLASTAGMKVALEYGIAGGPSTGVNFVAALHIASKCKKGSTIGTILADSSKWYAESYYNEQWIAKNFRAHGGLEVYNCWINVIRESVTTGIDPLEEGKIRC